MCGYNTGRTGVPSVHWRCKRATSDLILVLRCQFCEYLRETSYKHALELLEAARMGKNGKLSFFLRKRLTIIDLFEGL